MINTNDSYNISEFHLYLIKKYIYMYNINYNDVKNIIFSNQKY